MQEVEVLMPDGKKEKAIHYLLWQGKVKKQDRVLLNTTAVSLSLGSGGYHFIIIGLEKEGGWHRKKQVSFPGHIMKMRYTPLQFAIQSAEEETSPYHDVFQQINQKLLMETPVLIGELHSMLPGICYSLSFLSKKEGKDPLRVCYIMSDSAALPLSFSTNIHQLKKENLLTYTITIGHAFGGDLECVNIYSALHAAVSICQADIIMVAPGPGVVGTKTALGFSGMEQISLLQAVVLLGGKPIFIPRVSFTEKRERHRGISHHSLTVLRFAASIPLVLNVAQHPIIMKQLQNSSPNHDLVFYEKEDGYWREFQREERSILKTMGRSLQEDPYYFLHIFYSAFYTWNLKKGGKGT